MGRTVSGGVNTVHQEEVVTPEVEKMQSRGNVGSDHTKLEWRGQHCKFVEH